VSPWADNRMRAQSPFFDYVLYAVCPFYPVYRTLTAMEFDRNLRFNMDLKNFPEFSRLRLWTPGIRRNAGMLRARAQIRSDTRKRAFLNQR